MSPEDLAEKLLELRDSVSFKYPTIAAELMDLRDQALSIGDWAIMEPVTENPSAVETDYDDYDVDALVMAVRDDPRSYTEIAEAAGVSERTVRKIANYETARPHSSTVKKLADVLDDS